ncbi:MAG: DivIVA domain-containing protein [Lachnospiraceae bacterium]|nr:DivIVA domain-containing protein [Lachnospiraceae bacterium]
MLTPVDIQEKTFHAGLGYDKKDVNTFFEEVAKSYAELYRSNAELKEQVDTLTDGLQNYKSKEAALEKSLMLAEKDSEDTKAKALKEAKNIELDAKNKAKVIVSDAEKKLKKITKEIAVLETQYAAYKSNFCSLMKMQYDFLKENDFDFDAYIDEKALSLLGGGGSYKSQASAGNTFTGDPQMRDESTLGGAAGGSAYNEYGEDTRTSTSAVYTSGLGANENFVDPFNPNKEENGRYNPYDGRTAKSSTAGSSFKVSSGNKSGQKRNSSGKAKSTGSSSTQKSTKTTEESKPEPSKDSHKASDTADNVKPSASAVKEEKEAVTPEKETENVSKTVTEAEDTIPTIQPDVSDIEVTNANEQALLPDGDTPSEEADEDGFEFV